MRTLPHDEFVQTGGQATMIAGNARKRQRNEASKSFTLPNHVQRSRNDDSYCSSEVRADCALQDVHDRMVKLLPRLRRFICSLTRGLDLNEDLIQETCLRALTHLDQWQPGTRLDSWMFRIAQNLWIDHMRAEKIRGDVIDIASIDQLLSYDGRVVTENRLALEDLRKGIAQLSMEQRNVIRLVYEYGLSYKETGRILNLPAGTVMSRLARARDALHKTT
jgi:RNA polymerase sigma-70 factor (ECF subfamily)